MRRVPANIAALARNCGIQGATVEQIAAAHAQATQGAKFADQHDCRLEEALERVMGAAKFRAAYGRKS